MSRVRTALTPLETASGVVLGPSTLVPLPKSTGTSPVAELERVILPALTRPPCLVSFSGGLDSSCVLAVATRLARREGLELPVPATNRFPDIHGADETDWQEQVVAHLGLDDWLRLEFRDELDVVGPVAQQGLQRHGLLWPFNAHFHVPLLEAATGGSLLTGIGGDEAFGVSRWSRANDVLALRVRPSARDALPVVLALAPRAVRRAVLRRRAAPIPLPWLTAAGQRVFARASAAHEASEPRRYAARLEWWQGLRAVELGYASLELLAADAGARIVHPLSDPAFAGALVRLAPHSGPPARGPFMHRVFGGLLPMALFERTSKALFDLAFWRSHARGLTASWNGEAADPSLVDAAALQVEWALESPDPHSFTLLQSAWVERHGRQRLQGPRERALHPSPSRQGRAGGSTATPAATRAEGAAPDRRA